jgi:radical SAM protein (TIGR01212 family)
MPARPRKPAPTPGALPSLPYTPYSALLRARFGSLRVRKVPLHGGFTCPNLDGTKARGGCTYCDNRSFSPVAGQRATPLAAQFDAGAAYFRDRVGADGYIAYFQAFSGTYAPVARLRALYEEALALPGVVGISIGTRPDCVTPEVADLLDELSARTYVTLELGLQSAFDETLRRINRAHTFGEFAATMELCRGRAFERCVHVILGLPGEEAEHYRATAKAIGAWEYHSIKVHPLHVVRGTALAREHARGDYAPPTQAEYVEGLVDFLERIPGSVGVQRFTADAPPAMLAAPQWCRDKNAVLNAMKAEFARRGTRQGSRAEPREKTGRKSGG